MSDMFRHRYGYDKPTADAPMASRRDASWYRNPNCYGHNPRFHVTLEGYVSACNKNQPIISEELQPLKSVEAAERCQRSGCRERWPTKGK